MGVTTSAAIGGTAEVIGGGKPCDTGRQAARRSICGGGFSNGAVTGAFVYLLNHAQNKLKRNVPSKEWLESKANEAIEAEKAKIDNWIAGGGGAINLNLNFEGYSNSRSAFNLYNDPVTMDITLTIDGIEYPVVFRYNPSMTKAANIVTDVYLGGRAGYYGHAPELKGMPHLWLNNVRGGQKQYQIGFLYMSDKAYNAYLRYTNDTND